MSSASINGFPRPALPYVPHEAPMLLIDEIESCDTNRIVARVMLGEEYLFAQNGQVPAWVGIELMAQSCAAWSGFNAEQEHLRAPSVSENKSDTVVPIGYLLGTRNYWTNGSAFNMGCTLFIHAECLLQSSEGLGSFDCHIYDENQELLAQARLSVFQPRQTQTFSEKSVS